jgi:hypothetical protein
LFEVADDPFDFGMICVGLVETYRGCFRTSATTSSVGMVKLVIISLFVAEISSKVFANMFHFCRFLITILPSNKEMRSDYRLDHRGSTPGRGKGVLLQLLCPD